MDRHSLTNHIAHLDDMHSKLERELSGLEKQHQGETADAQILKKKKLQLKDELARCRQQMDKML